MEVQKDTEPVSKKEHRCDWCYEKIITGEKYHNQSGLSEDGPFINKFHLECWKAFNTYCEQEGDWGIAYWYPGSCKRGSLEER
jgi:hypothetical protein